VQIALTLDNRFDVIETPEPAASTPAAADIFVEDSVAGDTAPEEMKNKRDAAADVKRETTWPSMTEIVTKDPMVHGVAF